MRAKRRILVAMSGGVDSSVAACLLREQGHDVVGVFMRMGGEEAPATTTLPVMDADCATGAADQHRGCCSAVDAADARSTAAAMGIPFYVLNFREEFSRLKRYFADEYAAARTPNPCVMCNQWLKFGRLIEYADAVGADDIATGHYARADVVDGRPRLRRAIDHSKDQSYVLFGVPPETLRRTVFPLGELTKAQVRDHARRLGLSVHDKPESQDICFAPDRDYARVVRQYRPDAFRPGNIRDMEGRVLGRHEGLPNFTIGQRRGLRVAAGVPIYVTALDAETDDVVVGEQDEVCEIEAVASGVSWLIDAPPDVFHARVRVRYNHEAAAARVKPIGEGLVHVRFDDPQWAITPGQALVIYDGDEVLGGGWIDLKSHDRLEEPRPSGRAILP